MELTTTQIRMAKRIAEQRQWPDDDYRAVIAALKREQLEVDEILTIYRERLQDIEDIIRREKIVTLPKRDARIRFASDPCSF